MCIQFYPQNDLQRKEPKWINKDGKYALFTSHRQGRTIIEVIGLRFINSFDWLITPDFRNRQDPFEAFVSFTKMINALGQRGSLSLMPPLTHLVFWLEVFFLISCCFIAKVSDQ